VQINKIRKKVTSFSRERERGREKTTNEKVRKEMRTVKDDRCAFLMSATMTLLRIPTMSIPKNKCVCVCVVCVNEQKKKNEKNK